MKNKFHYFLVCGCFATCFNTGCLDEDPALYERETSPSVSQSITMKGISPANNLNPYDSVGLVHNELLANFLDNGYAVGSFEEIRSGVDSLSGLLPGPCPDPVPSSVLHALSLHPQSELAYLLETSSLGTVVQAQISFFIEEVVANRNEPFEDNYDWILGFEKEVMLAAYEEDEKKVLLSLTSIARYSLYFKKGRDDEDWDLSVGNLAGGFEGALHCPSQAVYAAVVAGLCNQCL